MGRLEVRDWIDVIHCDERIQPLGYLAWAACGKDPGFTPAGILEHAARARYSAAEVLELAFVGPPPDPAELSRRWRNQLQLAHRMVAALPEQEVGRCAMTAAGNLFQGDVPTLLAALTGGELRFHEGSIRGALPQFADTTEAGREA